MKSINDPNLHPYYIERDPLNFIVGKNAISEESGKSYKQVLSFHGDLRGALKCIAEKIIDDKTEEEYKSVKKYIKDCQEIMVELEEKIKNYV